MTFTSFLTPLWLASFCLWAPAVASAQAASPAGPPTLNSNAGSGSAKKPAPLSAAKGATGSTDAREISWDDLVPINWDPQKEIKAMNIDGMSDRDPRAMEMLKRMREVWSQAPINPVVDGMRVRIPGYIVPLEDSKSGMKEFLLVPYYGACIHTPPPPANQIIHVLPKLPTQGFRSMDTVWISGTLKTVRSDNYMGASGYQMEAEKVEAYVEKTR